MNKIKKGDQVIVISGRDKGKSGQILKIQDDGRALVNDINLVKKHTKPNPMAGVTGGILKKEAPIQLSNLAILNPKTQTNKYHCTPDLRTDVLFRGSCTCNLPTPNGYNAAQTLYDKFASDEVNIE